MTTGRTVSRFTPTHRLLDILADTPSRRFAAAPRSLCCEGQRQSGSPTNTTCCQEVADGAGRVSSIHKEAI